MIPSGEVAIATRSSPRWYIYLREVKTCILIMDAYIIYWGSVSIYPVWEALLNVTGLDESGNLFAVVMTMVISMHFSPIHAQSDLMVMVWRESSYKWNQYQGNFWILKNWLFLKRKLTLVQILLMEYILFTNDWHMRQTMRFFGYEWWSGNVVG